MRKVLTIIQYENERSFSIQLENGYSLLFKMHGNRSNIVLFQDDRAIHLFRNHLASDRDIKLSALHRVVDWDQQTFNQHKTNLSSLYYTFGKWSWVWLKERNFNVLDTEAQWKELNILRSHLEKPTYFLIHYQGELIFSLLPLGEIIKKFDDPIEAVNEFFRVHSVSHTLQSEKSILRKQLTDQIKTGKAYLQKNTIKLTELVNDNHYQLWGDLVMAHMHEMRTGMEKVLLTNFYDNTVVEIKLKKELNPQKKCRGILSQSEEQANRNR